MKDAAAGIYLADAMRDFASRITPENILDPDVKDLVDVIDAFGQGDFPRVRYLLQWNALFKPFRN